MGETRPANESVPPRRSIHLFDLDDTLIRTSARVLVRDEAGNLLHSLSTGEFTGYRAAPGEVLDFAEFSDLGILSRGIVVRYTRAIIDAICAGDGDAAEAAMRKHLTSFMALLKQAIESSRHGGF